MSSADDVLAAVRTTDWTRWTTPWRAHVFDYDPERVVPAFEDLVRVRSEDEALRAYHGVLDAVAHNHSGTPYPAVVEATRHLTDLVQPLDGWALHSVLSILIDCCLWTSGWVAVETVDGTSHDLTQVCATVASVRLALEGVAASDGHPAKATAAGLIDVLDSTA